MARQPVVSRTITTTTANVLCLDVVAGEPFNQCVVLPRTYKDEKTLMKKVSEVIDTDTVKAVHIVDVTVDSTLYGMSEEKFIEVAEKMPPRNTKTNTDKE